MKEKMIQLLMGQLALFFFRRKPNKRKWLFSSTGNTEFNYNSKYLFLYVKEYFPQVQPCYVINDDEKRKRLSEKYGEEYFIETKTFQGMKKALEAGVWFVSAGLPVYALGVGKKHTIVNLWHGVPLKKIVLMEENVSKLTKLYFKYVFSKNYRYVLTTSQNLVPIMAKSFDIAEEKVKVWGQPRNDAILQGNTKGKRLKEKISGLPSYKKVILYAPTYRDGKAVSLFPFADMDMERLHDYLEEQKILLCLRLHLEETADYEAYIQKRIINLNVHILDDVTAYLDEFDVLITDYSSVYIDYLLLNRPMIFLPYDKEEYLENRGMNFDYDLVTPGEKPNTFENFMKALDDTLFGDSYEEQRCVVNELLNQVRTPCSQDICERIYNMEVD